MELTKEYFDQQLSQLATKTDIDAINDRINALDFATAEDLMSVASRSEVGSIRSDIGEVKDLVIKLTRRDEQDIQAVIRDVAHLSKRVITLERRPSTP